MIPTFKTLFEDKKNRARVLILGPYTPPECKEKLERLKTTLQEKGFFETHLVSDFPDEEIFHPSSLDIHFQRKSFYYIKYWAQILIFILFQGCSNNGVLRELTYMVDHAIDKCDCSGILRSKEMRLSSLIRADIEEHRILESDFENEKDLQELAFATCTSILYSLFDIFE